MSMVVVPLHLRDRGRDLQVRGSLRVGLRWLVAHSKGRCELAEGDAGRLAWPRLRFPFLLLQWCHGPYCPTMALRERCRQRACWVMYVLGMPGARVKREY